MRTLMTLLLWAPAVLLAQTAGLDGKWRGEAGTSDNPAVFGLEFRPGADGHVAAWFYQDNLDYCGVPLGQTEDQGSGRFAIPLAGLKLARSGVSLRVVGLLDNPEEPVAFTRVPALPQCAPAPRSPTGPGPVWQRRLGGAIYATAAVRDGHAYVGNTDGVFYAIAIADGSIAWTHAAGRPIYGEALVTADAVFYACDNGYLYRLDRATGREQWRYDLGDERSARIPPNPNVYDYDRQSPRPLLLDGVLYVGAGDGGFHAVRADSGTRLWRTQWQGRIRTTATAHAGHVIFTTIDGADHGEVIAVKRASGELAWKYDARAPVTTTPLIAGDVVITGTRGERTHLLGLDAMSGSLKWSQYYWGSWVESGPVLADGEAYIGSGDLYSVSDFDPATGRNRWRSRVYGWVLARPAITAQAVFAGVSIARRNLDTGAVHRPGLVRLERATGRVAWQWPMPAWPGGFLDGFIAAPTVSGDRVLIGGVDGTLYAFPAD